MMRPVMLALAATTIIGVGASAVAAQPVRARVYPYPSGMTADEVRDFRMDQIERRQEMDREAMRFRQEAERRMVDPDDDD